MTQLDARSRDPEVPGGEARAERRIRHVAVIGEDLIWATRLLALVRSAGAEGRHARSADSLSASAADGVIVDLTTRAGDPLEQVCRAAADGVDVVCVGQHDDLEMRRRAVAAGASRVWTYNQVHAHGATLVGRWIRGEIGD